MTEEMSETQIQPRFQSFEKKSIFTCWSAAIHRFFELKGRTSRYEFWAFNSVSLVIFLLSVLVGWLLDEPKMVLNIFAVYFLLPAISISVRRLHDLGMSGWWTAPAAILTIALLICWDLEIPYSNNLLPFFALTYGTFLYWVLSCNGEPRFNKYGFEVKEPAVYNLDSRAFICFMGTFLLGLWAIFFSYIW